MITLNRKYNMTLVVSLLTATLLSILAFILLDSFQQSIQQAGHYALLALVVPVCFSVAGVVGMFINISERKLAEKELRQTLCILNATLESTVDGILVLDRKGKVINYNRQATLMLDIPEAVLTGQSDMKALELVLPMLINPAVFPAKIKALYTDQEADSYDVMEFLDGRIIECSSKPYRIDQKILGRVWSLRDVTSERKLEQQLRHARKMEALGVLAGGIAHDFNNILTLVVGYGNLMKHDIDPASPLMHGLEQILAAADRAADLTKGLLAGHRHLPG